MNQIDKTFWPASLAHLTLPYLDASSQYVTIAEVSSEPANGYPGTRLLYTAMVPKDEVQECLERTAGMGQGVSSVSGEMEFAGSPPAPTAAFWVESRRADAKRYQSLVETWRVHDRHILQPWGGLLRHFSLTPRVLQDGKVVWDDLSIPTYDVLRVAPVSIYTIHDGCSTARVEVLREYLEDFLFAHECAALATQFEQRFSTGDPIFDSAVGSGEGFEVKLPGRQFWLKRVENFDAGDQLSDVWCTRLVLMPEHAMDSEQTLQWPDHDGPIVGSGIMGGFDVMEEAYVRDEVLLDYENRPEFDIHPEDGSVGHNGWWSVGYCWRVGRDHIGLELRKLYEGAQFAVIKHYCAFALKRESIADLNEGKKARNIGTRTHDLVKAYLALIAALQSICDASGLSFTEKEIGSFSSAEIKYKGWWTFDALGKLGNVSLRSMTYPHFLARCKDLDALMEGLKPGPLRSLLRTLGVSKSDVDQHKSLKLSAFLCQLATIAHEQHWCLVTDSALILAQWDKNNLLDYYKPLFALNVLRQADAHTSSSLEPKNQSAQLATFGIDPDNYKAGWGLALDLVYDTMAESLRLATDLLQSVDLTD
jgi:hypothetical protein